jgi:hypothetical protein
VVGVAIVVVEGAGAAVVVVVAGVGTEEGVVAAVGLP